jgi:hypothetical protein
MTRQKVLIAILLIAIFSPLALRHAKGKAGGQSPDLAALSDDDLKTLTIRLERIQCYGSCPAYAVAIHGDGRVEYVGKQNVKVKESRNGRLDLGAVKVLASKFAEAKFLSLPEDDYSESKCKCRRCTDMASAVVEISVGSALHRVNHYYGCACPPKALFELESAIDKAVDSEQWTGDTSKQGPFGTTCFG